VTMAAQDRHGYIGVHTRAESQVQRPDDPDWNIKNARNRRFFEDRAGMSASRNLQPYLMQTYLRKIGTNKAVLAAEFDAPIFIANRHWGCVRCVLAVS
jgi:methyl-accepting chemotaxis protein